MTPPSSSPSALAPRPADTPVVGYVRSSKDAHDVSCEAQAEQIRRSVQLTERLVSLPAAPQGIFEDKALSSTRDDLPGLLALLDAAKQDPVPFRRVYVLDTSRIARDTLQAQSLKFYLRKKRGIELVFLHLPQTGSYMDEPIEKMMEVWDELHSRMSKAKGVEGQKQNIRRGYRAGGEAPYGYRRRVMVIGQHRSGQPITKSVNEPDPETAAVVQEYFRRRASGESRRVILRDFERRAIPSPSGRAGWAPATARGFEENVLAYLGHLVYGRMNERLREQGLAGGKKRGFVGGQKHRPRDDWTILENAHPALITPEIAAKVQARQRTLGVSDRRGTAYLLSGLLRCGLCEAHYIGSRSDQRYLYRCLTRSKGGRTACSNNDIARETIESFAIRILQTELLREDRLADLVGRFQRRGLTRKRRLPVTDGRALRAELDAVSTRLERILTLYGEGKLDEESLAQLNRRLRRRQGAIREQLATLEAPLEVDFTVKRERLRTFLADMDQWMREGDVVRRKTLLREVYQEIRIWPKTATKPWTRKVFVAANLDALTRFWMVSPTGFEPVFPD
jgi:Resolvase, N terminal domain/Recombinase/Recombinase zinc beta ribbon domain